MSETLGRQIKLKQRVLAISKLILGQFLEGLKELVDLCVFLRLSTSRTKLSKYSIEL